MRKMMNQSIKRMVLTGAAVTVMMSLAAPAAMAQEVVRDHRDGNGEAGPIVRDHRDGNGGILCSIFPASCEPPPYDVSDPVVPPPVVNDPPDPVVAPLPSTARSSPRAASPPSATAAPF
jgi:hypothetical protein